MNAIYIQKFIRFNSKLIEFIKITTWPLGLLVLIALLSGCATVQEKVIIKTELKLIKIPDALLVKCDVTEPPTRKEYFTKTPQQKEDILIVYSIKLIQDAGNCNNQIKKIKEFQLKEIKSIEEVKSNGK
jgi:hypothetical protein